MLKHICCLCLRWPHLAAVAEELGYVWRVAHAFQGVLPGRLISCPQLLRVYQEGIPLARRILKLPLSLILFQEPRPSRLSARCLLLQPQLTSQPPAQRCSSPRAHWLVMGLQSHDWAGAIGLPACTAGAPAGLDVGTSNSFCESLTRLVPLLWPAGQWWALWLQLWLAQAAHGPQPAHNGRPVRLISDVLSPDFNSI